MLSLSIASTIQLVDHCLFHTDPSISRLRSHMRHPSSSSIDSSISSQQPHVSRSVSSSHFSQLSRTTSSSTLHSLSSSNPAPPLSRPGPSSHPLLSDPLHYTTLKRISYTLYPSRSSNKLASMGALSSETRGNDVKNPSSLRPEFGVPSIMVANGLICVGTDQGWVGVWDFKGDMKGWFGSDMIGASLSKSPFTLTRPMSKGPFHFAFTPS